MLRNRSSSTRVMTGKQALMADQTSLASSPTQSQTSSVSSFLASPRIFNGLLGRTLSESDSVMSPTSILDTKSFSSFVIPFCGHQDQSFSKSPNNSSSENKHHFYEKVDGVGLAIVDSLSDEKNDSHLSDKPNSKMVMFGAKLKVQIPTLPSSAAAALSPGGGGCGTPKSPAGFGIKTRNSHLLMCCSPSGFGSPMRGLAAEGLSLSEMELSEDYTCVITHGPNPKTTHIFDDCVVENCCGVVKLSDLGKRGSLSSSDHRKEQSAISLKQGRDVFRGEKNFCSQEMVVEETKGKMENEDEDLLI